MSEWKHTKQRTRWHIYAGMCLTNKHSIAKLRANKPPPRCLSVAVQLPTIRQEAGPSHTHTHLTLLMSTYSWDPPLKSSNLFHITWETEQNTKLWKERKTIIQSRVQLEVVKLRLTAFPTGKRVLIWRLVIVTLLTFCLPSIFSWCIWIWTVFFYALLNECVWEASRRFAFWQARACSESGDVEVCGRIRWEKHTQT